MRTPLIMDYKTLTVYVIKHASMLLKLKQIQPKQYSPHHKILYKPHGESSANSINHRQKDPAQST